MTLVSPPHSRRRVDNLFLGLLLLKSFGQPEVEHLHHAFGCHLDVCGLQVTVDDTFLVCSFKGLSNLLRNVQRLFKRNRTFLDSFRQRRPFDQ